MLHGYVYPTVTNITIIMVCIKNKLYYHLQNVTINGYVISCLPLDKFSTDYVMDVVLNTKFSHLR